MMKHLFSAVKQLFLYGGLSKTEYDSLRNERFAQNYSLWKVGTVFSCLYSLVVFLSTLFLDSVSSNRTLYLVQLCCFVVLSLLFFLLAKKKPFLLELIIDAFLIEYLMFSAIMGTFISPQQLCVTYMVLLILMPLTIVTNPYRTAIIEVGSALFFTVFCFLSKTGEVLSIDLYDMFFFLMTSQVLNVLMTRIRLEGMNTGRKALLSSVTDELTGLSNRNSYEQYIHKHEGVPSEPNFTYISFDLNGLKNANDNYGHDAGDESIQGTADCIRECFSPYGYTYRIGGDEYAAIVFLPKNQLPAVLKKFDTMVNEWTGTYVDSIAVSYGTAAHYDYPGLTLSELSKLADKAMYEKKRIYYEQKSIQRRKMPDTCQDIYASYLKILEVDLTDDTFRVIQMIFAENNPAMGYSERFSQWMFNLGSIGIIHPEDLKDFQEKTNINALRMHFRMADTPVVVYYRRKVRASYHMSMMEIVPHRDGIGDYQSVLLYVKDLEPQNH